MVGNSTLCLCLWLGWWEICCHPVAHATSPCWGLSCWLWLLCVSFVKAQGTSELKYSSLALASLKQLLYGGGILRAFLHAALVSYITQLCLTGISIPVNYLRGIFASRITESCAQSSTGTSSAAVKLMVWCLCVPPSSCDHWEAAQWENVDQSRVPQVMLYPPWKFVFGSSWV